MPKAALALQAEQRILILRDQKVMLDFHLAELYGVETRTLKQAVRRNSERFPEDFMFELSEEEVSNLRSQTVISSFHGGSRHGNLAFTEQGVAMLSSVRKIRRHDTPVVQSTMRKMERQECRTSIIPAIPKPAKKKKP